MSAIYDLTQIVIFTVVYEALLEDLTTLFMEIFALSFGMVAITAIDTVSNFLHLYKLCTLLKDYFLAFVKRQP